MTNVVIASADQSLVFQLRSAIQEMVGVDAEHVADTTDELIASVLRLDPDVVLVDDALGPDPALQVVRDLSLRRPTCAAVIVSGTATPDAFAAAMEAGARGLVTAPPVSFEDLRRRIETAAGVAQNMRLMMASAQSRDGGPGRARVITFTGAKGGVGTTTIATHLALDVLRTMPGRRVCLIDLDLEKGDVGAVIDVRHRASIADVAKVSADLSARAVADAVVVHESGLHLLLAPHDVRDVEEVSARALREVAAVLRQSYDLVVIDAGSHVTPTQAAAVELADEVVVVTTPDVLSLRGLRRSIAMWEGLAVRKEGDVRVLVNRSSRQSSVSAESVRELTRAPVMSVALPSMFRRLELAINARDPYVVREGLWWKGIRALVVDLGAAQTTREPAAEVATEATEGRTGRRRSRRRGSDTGSAAIDLVATLPLVLFLLAVVWQLGLYGMSAVWVGHASAAAARAAAIGTDPGQAAREALPAGVASSLSVSRSGDEVTVAVAVPMAAPGLTNLPVQVSSTSTVVREP